VSRLSIASGWSRSSRWRASSWSSHLVRHGAQHAMCVDRHKPAITTSGRVKQTDIPSAAECVGRVVVSIVQPAPCASAASVVPIRAGRISSSSRTLAAPLAPSRDRSCSLSGHRRSPAVEEAPTDSMSPMPGPRESVTRKSVLLGHRRLVRLPSWNTVTPHIVVELSARLSILNWMVDVSLSPPLRSITLPLVDLDVASWILPHRSSSTVLRHHR